MGKKKNPKREVHLKKKKLREYRIKHTTEGRGKTEERIGGAHEASN